MSKRKQEKRREARARKHQRQRRTKQLELAKARSKLFLSAWWKAIGVVSVLIGIATGVLSLSARVSVLPSYVLDPSNPFSTQFEVTNQGHLSIYNIKFTCRYNSVKTASDTQFTDSSYTNYMHEIPEISPNKTASVPCYFPLPSPVEADVSLVVSYRPSLIPWRKEDAFRFVANKKSDGTLVWLPQPVSAPKP